MMNRLEKINFIRKKLNDGNYSIGSWIQIPHSSIAEIIGNAGYDWVAVDLEHGSISVDQLPDLFRALELGNTLPLARIAKGDLKDCKQVLDAGAGGVIVPMVESAEHLEKIKNEIRWPPSGKRGVGFSRANLFGKNFESYSEEAQKPLLVAMIEHLNAVKNLDEILKVDNLDAIFIGPYDLSASMGITAQFETSKFKNIIGKIKEKAKLAGVACGIHVVEPSENDLRLKIDDGYRFIAYSIDSVIFSKFVKRPFS